MTIDSKDSNSAVQSPQRRKVLQAGASVAGAVALGFPAIVRSQSGPIKIGHLTPMTGFLGALGNWAVLGIKMAQEEINASGGVMGRQLDIFSEDSVNPATAATKAQRMFERDGAEVLIGEISSASAKTIMQVAERNKRLFMSTGPRSDALRGEFCNRYTFHVDIPVTVMVNAEGQGLLREGLIKGQRIYALTSDYLFGHDLAKAAKKFVNAHGGKVIADDLVSTDTTDFSPYLLKVRQAKPDLIATNLGGNQVTNFVKQYAEFGLPYPVAGFNLNTADAWAAGRGNLGGIWPTVWHQDIDTPGTKAFVAAFRKKYGKTPENHAWIEYVSLKAMVQAMNATKSTNTDKLIAYFETEAKIDLLKPRKGYFRNWDHQMMQEAYTFTVKKEGTYKEEWDFLKFSAAIPDPDQPLELLAPTKAENPCTFK
ncbi:MAG: ABC transporter substrate-binding protein [Betaproteobacteria bacterium]|jgi:branched-chain amino acid transport system substrate-binding protein|nr:ABC transporter substrate-binding protein [Betaproteobacteria bacterium]